MLTIRGLVARLVLILGALAAQAQTVSPVTVTPTLVSIQLGLPVYCAAKWSPLPAGTIQVYCYTTVKTTWDTLVYNSIFPAFSGAFVPCVFPNKTDGITPDLSHAITWIFQKDAKTGFIDWTVGWAGTSQQTGTFQ